MGTVRTAAAIILGLLASAPGALGGQHPDAEEASPPTVTRIEVLGLDALDPPVRLPRRLPLRAGEPYTIARIEELDAVLVEAFAERGRPYVSVELDVEIDRDAGTASVRLEVTDVGPPVRFGPVQVFGQPPIDEEVIRERLAYEPGDPYRPSGMAETRDRLLMLPIVAEAVVFPLGLETGETVVGSVVSVAAVPRPREPELSGTLSSARCLELRGFWHDRYFLDAPRLLSVGAGVENLLARQLGNRFPCSDVGEDEFAAPGYFASVEVQQPWPGSPLTTVTGALSLRRSSASQAYVLRSAGARLAVRRALGPDVSATLSYAPDRTEVRAAGFYFCAAFGACEEAEVQALQDARRFAPVELAVRWLPRRTRAALMPRPALPGLPPPRTQRLDPALREPGWRPWLYVELQAAGRPTGSSLGWRRLEVEGAAARIFGDRGELVARTRIGWVGKSGAFLPPHLRFYSGGLGSVRGAEQNLLGPLILFATPERAVELGCTLEDGGCPPGTVGRPGLVNPRPRGADLLLEGNLEVRARLTTRLQIAAFVDYAVLRAEDRLPGTGTSRPREGVATPGAGLRIATPIGLVRVDAGYDTRGTRHIPLLAPDPDDGTLRSLGEIAWNPHTHDAPGTVRRFLRRIQLGVAIGQPF